MRKKSQENQVSEHKEDEKKDTSQEIQDEEAPPEVPGGGQVHGPRETAPGNFTRQQGRGTYSPQKKIPKRIGASQKKERARRRSVHSRGQRTRRQERPPGQQGDPTGKPNHQGRSWLIKTHPGMDRTARQSQEDRARGSDEPKNGLVREVAEIPIPWPVHGRGRPQKKHPQPETHSLQVRRESHQAPPCTSQPWDRTRG